MKQQYLECGKIVGAHGLRGDLKVQPWGNSPQELCQYRTLFLDKGHTRLEVEKIRVQKQMVLLKAAGVDSIEAAQALRGRVLYIDRELDSLEEGQYYIQDLLGLTVVDADDGHSYGTLCDYSETGANDVYHIRFADGKERLIPAIPQVVVAVDVAGGVMQIRPLPGLFEGAEEIREDD